MSKTKAMVLGIVGSVILLIAFLLGTLLPHIIVSISPASAQYGYQPSLTSFIILIIPLTALIGSIIISKKQRLGGIITLFGGILAIVISGLTIFLPPNDFLTPVRLSMAFGMDILPILAVILVLIAGFMAIFSKPEDEQQKKIKQTGKLTIVQEIKRVRDLGLIGGSIAIALSIIIFLLTLLVYGMYAKHSRFDLVSLVILGPLPIIFSIIITILSVRIANNIKTKSKIIIVLSSIGLLLSFFYNIAFIATIIAGIKGLKVRNITSQNT